MCCLDCFTAGEPMDGSIFMHRWYEMCDLMSLTYYIRFIWGEITGSCSTDLSCWRFSWHAPLICLLTQEKRKRKVRLRWEQKACSRSCWIGSGCWQCLFFIIYIYIWVIFSMPLCWPRAPLFVLTPSSDWLKSRVEPFLFWKAYVMLMPAGDGWRRTTLRKYVLQFSVSFCQF